jgi:very-short-patch-repair endonuclease
VVEVDGFAFHSTGGSFEQDRRRDARLMAAGLRVMRVTWRQLVREPEAVVARLAQALARGRSAE